MKTIVTLIPMFPLVAALLCAIGGKHLGRVSIAVIANLGVALALVFSIILAFEIFTTGAVINFDWFTWAQIADLNFKIGFLIDELTVIMLLVVTFVSFMVHIYTIGYMHDDPGVSRFFCYIELFTFAMLMLVMSNNFLQLFFGWEAVGLVSYLLIGFWFKRPTAITANLKAFLVNRVGDFGFLIGIGLILAYFNSLDYYQVFGDAGLLAGGQIEITSAVSVDAATLICIALFVGAMGKSAQFPLHVWLPDSMEGPTPISALIHAATMVTAGIFMVARMAPLFEESSVALMFVMTIGGITALFMGILGLVQHDIKRVIAYSTLSQLGYMTAALGASAYPVAIFHLVTHAFFKALLFLGAGAIIVALHHKQDMREMGGLKKRMPITFVTMLIGSLALCGIPPLAGFFSKDLVIEAVRLSDTPVSQAVHYALVGAAFITALYSFRLIAIVFNGTPRMSAKDYKHVKDCNWTITIPLVILAIPSVFAGMLLMKPILNGSWFVYSGVVKTLNVNIHIRDLLEIYPDPFSMLTHVFYSSVFYISVAGIAVAMYVYTYMPALPGNIANKTSVIYKVLLRNYGFDDFNNFFFAGGSKEFGGFLWKRIDNGIIDNYFNSLAMFTKFLARKVRAIQTGHIYHYAFVMIISLAILLPWLIRS